MKTSWFKTLAAAAIAAFTFGFAPSAQAESVSYLEPVYKTAGDPTSGIDYWETKSVGAYTEVTSGTTEWTEGWYVVEGNVGIGGRITCVGDVRLILKDGATLNANAGITVSGDANALTVYAQSTEEATMGTLVATSAADTNAGIGGASGVGQNITINGGIVTATGGKNGAGIGGGAYSGAGKAGHDIVINGGKVTARCINGSIETEGWAAGIGGGDGGSTGVGYNITINGGDVLAYNGGGYGAGIGGGSWNATAHDITINGGAVRANVGSNGGSAIGAGSGSKGASRIKISTRLITRADNSQSPTTVIENTGGDLATSLKGKRYATVMPSVEVVPTPVEHATAKVYYADGEIVKGPPFNVEKNTMVMVVYTSEDGYAFGGGASSYETEAFKADTDPTPMPMDPPAAPTAVTTGVEYLSPVYVGGVVTNGINLWVTCKVGSYTAVTDQTVWGEAHKAMWYVVEGEVAIDSRITCLGDVRLILKDGATLTANAGITVTGDANALTVYAQSTEEATMGALEATSAADTDAGIGGAFDVGQNITINGGIVTATGGKNGAGIGGGGNASVGKAGHDIVINGGKVTARCLNGSIETDGWAAGIGGGDGGSTGEGYNITINGGDVLAYNGGGYGAGIGAGSYLSNGHDITINGGTVRANVGSSGGSAIGGAMYGTASGIKISTNLVTKAGDAPSPQTVIENTGDDLATSLKGQRYATVAPPPSVESVTLDKTSAMVQPGTAFALKATITPAECALLPINWYSTNENVATVTGNETEAYVVAVGEGQADIVVECGGKADGCSVTVKAVPAQIDAEYVAPVYREGIVTNGIDHWVTNMAKDAPVITDQTTWGAAGETNWYVVAVDATIGDRITCLGDVRLILADGATLYASAGITVSGDANALTVYAQKGGTGALKATGENGAGIGGFQAAGQHVGQNITINGGTVAATGGGGVFGGAGIGGVYADDRSGVGQDIVINGGNVTATGGNGGGAGIGGGGFCVGRRITLNGGIVEASSSWGGAGIGGGGTAVGEDITINGGTVTATGGANGGAGIGGGDASGGQGRNIRINGGTVTATGGSGTASGIGNGGSAQTEATNIFISTALLTKADGNNPPETVIENTGGDLARSLKGKRYATVEPMPPVTVTPQTVANSVAHVYTNGVEVALSGEPPSCNVYSNQTDTIIVYTANPGYAFPGGATTYTNNLDTAKDPATLVPGQKVPSAPTKPVEYLAPVYVGGVVTNGIDHWETNKVSQYTEVTSTMTTWGKAGETNWYVVAGNVTINASVMCVGDVRLIVKPGCTLTVNGAAGKAAINVTGANALTVYETPEGGGTLNALCYTGTDANGAAGIGGNPTEVGENITINGCTVNARGSTYSAGAGAANGGAGIGGGAYYGEGSNLVFNAGTVTATAGGAAAGIGGGMFGSGSYITVNGGVVIANGNSNGAGIGGGQECSGEHITINGGTVTATGDPSTSYWGGAGIGGGGGSSGSRAASFIVIRGGTVTATGGNGATGIGNGANGVKASDIYVDRLVLAGKVGDSADPTTPVANDGGDLAGQFNGKRYAVVKAGGSIDVSASEEGTADVPAAAWTDETVTITAKPAAGYELDTLTAYKTGEPQTAVEVSGSAFTMPAFAVTVKPTFKKVTDPVEYLEPVYVGGVVTNGIDHWETNKVSQYTEVTSTMTTWGAAGQTNWYVVASEVGISGGVTCVGDVRLILKDNAKLTVGAGIVASTNTSGYIGFSVYAQSQHVKKMGVLEATGGVNGAGIGGGGQRCSGEYITINGGTVTATGGESAAGIGGGEKGSGEYITINGGTVNATGRDEEGVNLGGAGIGGGDKGSGSNITINGGTVNATGGYAAGIGGGYNGGTGSVITINDGVVEAICVGGMSAGIGGGGMGGSGSNITINGGTVTATGNDGGAGIGGGGIGAGEYITINGGTVEATGGCSDLGHAAAGIGGGDQGSGEYITINGGKVTATSGGGDVVGAAGIGGGSAGAGSSITINGGTVFVANDGYCELIGNGCYSRWGASDVTISADAKVFFSLVGVDQPMPESFEGFTIMTPETPVERVLVGGIANWTAAKTFNLTNAVTAATGTITVNGAVVFANKLLKLPHDATDKTLKLTVEDLPTGIQVGDTAWAVIDETGKSCTIVGAGDMWNHTQWPGGKNPLAEYQWTIKDLTVADDVTGIGSEAFHKFYGLTNATFAASVTNVGNYAFLRCNSLERLAFAGGDVAFGKTPFALMSAIYMKDGMPVVYPIPQVTIAGYTQKLYGSEDLKNWTEIKDEGQKTQFHFFKIVLEK